MLLNMDLIGFKAYSSFQQNVDFFIGEPKLAQYTQNVSWRKLLLTHIGVGSDLSNLANCVEKRPKSASF